MNQTSNYQLNQWDPEDRILRTDFNSDNAKIDAALEENTSAIAAETEARMAAINDLAETRNCRVVTMNYSGDGQSSRTFTFSGKPVMITAMGYFNWACAVRGSSVAGSVYLSDVASSGSTSKLTASWGSNSVTITSPRSDASAICNRSGQFYQMVAILEV